MLLSEAQAASLDRLIEAKTLISFFEKIVKLEEGDRKTDFMEWFVNELWENKAVPVNPKVLTPSNAATFQMKISFRPEKCVPAPKNRAANKSSLDYITDAIVDAGLTPALAKRFVKENLRLEKAISLCYDDASLVERFFNMINSTSKVKLTQFGVFTEDEKESLFEFKDVVRVVNPDTLFLRAVAASSSLDQLRGLIRVFNPDISIANLQFAVSAKLGDTPKLDAAQRLLYDSGE